MCIYIYIHTQLLHIYIYICIHTLYMYMHTHTHCVSHAVCRSAQILEPLRMKSRSAATTEVQLQTPKPRLFKHQSPTSNPKTPKPVGVSSDLFDVWCRLPVAMRALISLYSYHIHMRQQTIVHTSRFVRVILAQGPC